MCFRPWLFTHFASAISPAVPILSEEGRHAFTELLQVYDEVTEARASNSNDIYAVYLDPGKAFDKVLPSALINKLFCFGIFGKLGQRFSLPTLTIFQNA